MSQNTAQNLEENTPRLRLVYSQDTTTDLRETSEQTKEALLREIDRVVKKYKPDTSSEIGNIERMLCERVFTEKLPEDSVKFHASESIASKIYIISKHWEELQKGLVFSDFEQPKWPELVLEVPKWPTLGLEVPKWPAHNLDVARLPDSYDWSSPVDRGLFGDDLKFESDGSQTVNGLDAIQKELEVLSNLKDNWDGHDGCAISKSACDHAWLFVTLLGTKANHFEPYPDPDGSVGLEYHNDNNVSAYFSFSADGGLAYVIIMGDEVHRGHGVYIENEIPPVMRSIIDAVY